MNKIIFIDYTCDRTHKNICNIAIGASEYQFYNFVRTISTHKNNGYLRTPS